MIGLLRAPSRRNSRAPLTSSSLFARSSRRWLRAARPELCRRRLPRPLCRARGRASAGSIRSLMRAEPNFHQLDQTSRWLRRLDALRRCMKEVFVQGFCPFT